MLVPGRYTTSNQSHQIPESVDGQVSCQSGQKPGRQNWANTTWVWTWMGPLNHVVDRDRESHSREWDLRILCAPPLEQWTRPVCAYAWHSTLPTATCYRWLYCYQQWLQYLTMTSVECRHARTAVERHPGSEMTKNSFYRHCFYRPFDVINDVTCTISKQWRHVITCIISKQHNIKYRSNTGPTNA